MFSVRFIFGLGLVVSVLNMSLWAVVLRSQFKQLRHRGANTGIKVILLTFGAVSMFSNVVAIWFDIYRLAHIYPIPSNISYAYITTQYLYRTATAIMFYLIYRY